VHLQRARKLPSENLGDASSADVAALVSLARQRVRERFQVELEHEVELLGPIALD
jgi:UDP-N-acetylenolpyruvoylglucosamine reductase